MGEKKIDNLISCRDDLYKRSYWMYYVKEGRQRYFQGGRMASVPQEEENKEVVNEPTVNKESNEQKEDANANKTNTENKSVVKDSSNTNNVNTPKGSNNTTKKPSTNVTKPSTNKTETNNKVETPTQSEGDYLARVEDEIFNATNAERQKQGLPALKRN